MLTGRLTLAKAKRRGLRFEGSVEVITRLQPISTTGVTEMRAASISGSRRETAGEPGTDA